MKTFIQPTPPSWLWPDRPIGKRESRELREQFNALVNSHAALLDVVRKMPPVLRGVPEHDHELNTVARALMAAGDTTNCNANLADDLLK